MANRIGLWLGPMIGSVLLLMCLVTLNVYACQLDPRLQKTTLKFPAKANTWAPELDYAYQLLERVIAIGTDQFGDCQLVLVDDQLSLKRIEHQLEHDSNIDLAVLTVSQARDERFRVIPTPLSGGLRGYRLLLISTDSQPQFSLVKSLSDLSALTAGQGHGWADSKILQFNQLKVVEAGSVTTLVDMLSRKRFNYFPRGALEAVVEEQKYGDKGVIIESDLVLIYPSMTAFYVKKSNTQLAKRIEYGLGKMMENGEFKRFMANHSTSASAFKVLDLERRNKIYLCNPFLPSWVPLAKDEYWLHPWPKSFIEQDCSAVQN